MLETLRCHIRPFSPDDARDFYEMNLDADVMRYTGDAPFKSVDEAADFIKSYRSGSNSPYKDKGFGRMTAVRSADQAYLGFVGLKRHRDGNVDIGYRLKRQFWGQGFATELAKAVIDYGFTTIGLETIIAQVHEQNIGSQIVAERCGMKLEYRFLWEDRLPGRWYKISSHDH